MVDISSENKIQPSGQLQDMIRTEGINYLGFGIIYKYAMMDTEISIGAKGIYAYFCSYTGSGATAFPSRDRIVSDLHITKDTYYKYFHELISAGYITVEQRNAGGRIGFMQNIYTIKSFPSCMQHIFDSDPDIAKEGIRHFGYGTIPKSIMTDKRVMIKGKALYAYFCSFAGVGSEVHPKKDNILYHLGMGDSTYRKITSQLKELGYISVSQKKTGGTFGNNSFILNELVNGKESREEIKDVPCVDFSDTLKKDSQYQVTSISDTQSSYTVYPDTRSSDAELSDMTFSDMGEPDANNNNHIINNIEQHQSYHLLPEINDRKMDVAYAYAEAIREQVGYDYICVKREQLDRYFEEEKIELDEYDDMTAEFDPFVAEHIIDWMLDVICAQSKRPIRINGEDMPRNMVKSRLMKTDPGIFRKVIRELNTNPAIKNRKRYAISMLYNG